MRRIVPLSRINSSLSLDWSLSTSDVEERKIQYGTNDIIETRKNRWIELLIDTAKDPMIWFLLITAALFAILKNYSQAIILFLATIPLIGMDTFLHWRTQISTQSLNSLLTAKAIVIRNGLQTTIPSFDIVPGDLVIVPTGMPFPADGIIISGNNLQIDESALTGESYPAKKEILTQFTEALVEPAIDSRYWGFAGTRVLTGRAMLRIVYTGRDTLYGEIVSSAVLSTQTRTPLQIAIGKLVLTLIAAATIFCIVLAGVRYYQGFGIIDALLSAATLAVAALPDEFPLVFTFFLGVGVYRLAKKKALVRRSVSVENIGRITYICSDKTGTITEGRFKLSHYISSINTDENQLLYLAGISSRKDSGDLLDLAIYAEIENKKIIIPRRIKTIPFTEERKRETSIAQYNTHQWIIATKGAPETILSISTLTEDEKKFWVQKIENLASSGNKVIACAHSLADITSQPTEPQLNYHFSGLLGFTDPPREGVIEAVTLCRQSKIHVLMITGDHPETARAIAREIGLRDGYPNVILAQDLKLHALKNADEYFRSIDVIARTLPSQKLDIVSSLQAAGEIVAVTGDGVNDVPALKTADIGIAMGERGTQSAREAADIVLLDDNFDSIVNAIGEGRQLFKNMQLSFKYLLLIHIPFVISAAVIPLLGYPLLYYPIHIVFIELIIHPTCMLVFQDLPQTKKLDPPRRQRIIHFFSGVDWTKLVVIGTLATMIVIISYIVSLHKYLSTEHARALAIAELSFISAALTISLSGFRTWIARIISLFTISFSTLLIQIPLVSTLLSFTPLNITDWLITIISSLIIFLLVKI